MGLLLVWCGLFVFGGWWVVGGEVSVRWLLRLCLRLGLRLRLLRRGWMGVSGD